MIGQAYPLTLQTLAQYVKEWCDANPDDTFSTTEMVKYAAGKYYQQTPKELYKAFAILSEVTGFDYCTKGDFEKRKIFGVDREVRANLWRCPSTGPCELPIIARRNTDDKVAYLEQRIAELETQLGERIKTVEMLLGI